jgi:hypothetical protein
MQCETCPFGKKLTIGATDPHYYCSRVRGIVVRPMISCHTLSKIPVIK